MTKPETETSPDVDTRPSTFASRRAEREAAEAAGQTKPKATRQGFRAGIDAETPSLVIRHVAR